MISSCNFRETENKQAHPKKNRGTQPAHECALMTRSTTLVCAPIRHVARPRRLEGWSNPRPPPGRIHYSPALLNLPRTSASHTHSMINVELLGWCPQSTTGMNIYKNRADLISAKAPCEPTLPTLAIRCCPKMTEVRVCRSSFFVCLLIGLLIARFRLLSVRVLILAFSFLLFLFFFSLSLGQQGAALVSWRHSPSPSATGVSV